MGKDILRRIWGINLGDCKPSPVGTKLFFNKVTLQAPEAIPAIDRYDGPMYRVLRSFLRENCGTWPSPTLTPLEKTCDACDLRWTCDDLEKSRRFYEKALGLPVSKESKNIVSFSGTISLVKKSHESEILKALSQERKYNISSIIHIETSSLEATRENIRRFGVKILQPGKDNERDQKYFRCFDPDGNIVEIFESIKIA